jgi:hypothetical protein
MGHAHAGPWSQISSGPGSAPSEGFRFLGACVALTFSSAPQCHSEEKSFIGRAFSSRGKLSASGNRCRCLWRLFWHLDAVHAHAARRPLRLSNGCEAGFCAPVSYLALLPPYGVLTLHSDLGVNTASSRRVPLYDAPAPQVLSPLLSPNMFRYIPVNLPLASSSKLLQLSIGIRGD